MLQEAPGASMSYTVSPAAQTGVDSNTLEIVGVNEGVDVDTLSGTYTYVDVDGKTITVCVYMPAGGGEPVKEVHIKEGKTVKEIYGTGYDTMMYASDGADGYVRLTI